jgi:anti-sigma factor RsiW
MTCEEARATLLDYHFGTLEDRAALEAHLVDCRACLAHFFELKRAVELGEAAPRPSRDARARLRAAVADELRPKRPAPVPRAWWERPAAFALAASVVLVAGAATHVIQSGSGAPPYALRER